MDTVTISIEKKYWAKLHKANYVGGELGQEKNVYGYAGIV